MSNKVRIVGPTQDIYEKEILTPEALAFVAHLHRRFNADRLSLLNKRKQKQEEISAGLKQLGFASETSEVRGGSWQVAPAPSDLMDRRVEITGPTERKMMINALNSGAKVFMADLEDALSPSWENVQEGHLNLKKAVRRELDFTAENGKEYKLKDTIATLLVRPRGWHLEESHLLVDEEPVSASLFDFGMYFFHNAQERINRGSAPYFYLPKLEHYLEARLWNRVFVEAQNYLEVPQQTIRATVLIETITAAFQMEEILFELRDHISGLNAGRWDYIFSYIKRFHQHPEFVLPDRSKVTMQVPFMRAYTNLLVKSCHAHGAHAIGGMSAFIPNRKLQEVTLKAVSAVKDDKEREARDGFDGTWVAHPDLVPTAKKAFDDVLGENQHQKSKLREDVRISSEDLLTSGFKKVEVTEQGVRLNIRVAIQYVGKWLSGMGAVAIDNLMEDAATAEISRAQLWQWINHNIPLDDGRYFDSDLYKKIKAEELHLLQRSDAPNLLRAADLLDSMVLNKEFCEFLTIPAYALLNK